LPLEVLWGDIDAEAKQIPDSLQNKSCLFCGGR
jgi:hypothetical protein